MIVKGNGDRPAHEALALRTTEATALLATIQEQVLRFQEAHRRTKDWERTRAMAYVVDRLKSVAELLETMAL